MEISHRFVETNGIRMHVAEAGQGPLVVLCHGFPESWYSWRHQLDRAGRGRLPRRRPRPARLRPDRRAPRPSSSTRCCTWSATWSACSTRSGEKTAVIVGHDWGAPVAWHAALLRPDRFRARRRPQRAVPAARRRPPDQRHAADARTRSSTSSYFQEPGVAEAELERDPRATIRRVLYWASGEAREPAGRRRPTSAWCRAPAVSSTAPRPSPAALPAWLDRGRPRLLRGRVRARRLPRRAELVPEHRPQLGAAGAVDGRAGHGARALRGRRPRPGAGLPRHGPAAAGAAKFVPKLRKTIILPGCGHWTQQERPAEVNAAMLEFLKGLG